MTNCPFINLDHDLCDTIRFFKCDQAIRSRAGDIFLFEDKYFFVIIFSHK